LYLKQVQPVQHDTFREPNYLSENHAAGGGGHLQQNRASDALFLLSACSADLKL